jgi:hypothetical protein
MGSGRYDSLIRSWVEVFPSWAAYNATVGPELTFEPTPQPAVLDGRPAGVTNNLRDLDGLSDGPDRMQILVLPAGADVYARPAVGDEDVPCALLACGLDWQPPVALLVRDATLRDAKWVFVERPSSLTAALHIVRTFR